MNARTFGNQHSDLRRSGLRIAQNGSPLTRAGLRARIAYCQPVCFQETGEFGFLAPFFAKTHLDDGSCNAFHHSFSFVKAIVGTASLPSSSFAQTELRMS